MQILQKSIVNDLFLKFKEMEFRMKKLLLTTMLFLLIGVGVNGNVYSTSEQLESFVEKTYLSAEQIVVDNEGLFAIIDDEVVELQAIMHDECGIYCYKPSFYWRCQRCGFGKNPAWNNFCQECGGYYRPK